MLKRDALAGLLLFGLVLATFLPALDNGFVGYDDPEYVTANPHVQQGLTPQTLRWAFSNTDVAAWHPLTWLSHALDCQLFGLRPWGHHLSSLLLHGLNAVLCFLVLFQLTGAFARSWAVAALFALHPLRVESVAWVSERKDVLSVTFFFLTLWAYHRYVKLQAPRAITWLSLSLIFYVLGLMSKPMLVTLPLVLLLLDGWPLGRWASRTARDLLKEKVPFFLAAALVSVVTVLAQPGASAITAGTSLPYLLENAAVSYCRYLGKTVWPAKLAVFYPPIDHWSALTWLSAAALLLAITLAAVGLRRTRPYLLIGWLWFLGTLVPVIGLIRIGEQSVTDRYSYLPSLGLLFMVVWGISELLARWPWRRPALGTILAAVLITCFCLTRNQVRVWKNSETLFRHALAVTKGNYLAHNNLGVVFEHQGRWPEALGQYQQALEIKPGYAEALKNLGVAFDHLGQLEKAIEFFRAAIRQQPGFAAAYNGLGLVYERQGRFQSAAQQFEAAIAIKPDYADAHFNLALELERQGQMEQAVAEFLKTLELQPNSADVHSNLGVLFEKQGRLDEAIQQYQAALQLNPNYARAYFNLGVALAKRGMIQDAISAFQTALKLNPDYPAARTNLAMLKSLGPH